MEEKIVNFDNHMETQTLGEVQEEQMPSPSLQIHDECKQAPQLYKEQEQQEQYENEEEQYKQDEQEQESHEYHSSEELEEEEEEYYEEEEKTAERCSNNKGESVSRALKSNSSNNNSSNEDDDNPASYQELPRFCTWRKHVRDLYQQLVHIDLVWESTVAQFMPYVSMKNNLLTHTLLSATRTSGQEQCFLQLLNVTLPDSTITLENQLGTFSEVTGEVGGYGMAPNSCGVKIERRILHDGDVLAARAMPANPLLLASSSSNGHLYVFDWSRVSLNKFPNDPPRPRGPLPPNALTHGASEEERSQYHKRMRELNAIAAEQDRWDKRRSPGQHMLTLIGGNGESDNVEWSILDEGILASGSAGKLCTWRVGDISKDASRVVEPCDSFAFVENKLTRISCSSTNIASDCNKVNGKSSNEEMLLDPQQPRCSSVKWMWTHPSLLLSAWDNGCVYLFDTRTPEGSTTTTNSFAPLRQVKNSKAATAIATSLLQSHAVLIGDECGCVTELDLRFGSISAPSVNTYDVPSTSTSTSRADGAQCLAKTGATTPLHQNEITTLEWCPHSAHLFASGGADGNVCIYNTTRHKMLFRHSAHTETIMDLAWNWQDNCAGQLLSVDSFAITLWRPRDYFFYKERS